MNVDISWKVTFISFFWSQKVSLKVFEAPASSFL